MVIIQIGHWAWSTTSGNGEIGYDATKGMVKTASNNGKTIAYWNMSALAPKLISDAKADDNCLNFIIRNGNWDKDPGGKPEN